MDESLGLWFKGATFSCPIGRYYDSTSPEENYSSLLLTSQDFCLIVKKEAKQYHLMYFSQQSGKYVKY